MFDGLDPKIMLFTAVVFLIMLSILNALLYKPMLAFMKAREESMLSDEQKIVQNQTEANNNEALVGKILSDARAKAKTLKDEEVMQAKANAQANISALKVRLEEQHRAHLQDLEQSKMQLREALKGQFDTFAAKLEVGLKNI